jgi:soluble P-type ATPase
LVITIATAGDALTKLEKAIKLIKNKIKLNIPSSNVSAKLKEEFNRLNLILFTAHRSYNLYSFYGYN